MWVWPLAAELRAPFSDGLVPAQLLDDLFEDHCLADVSRRALRPELVAKRLERRQHSGHAQVFVVLGERGLLLLAHFLMCVYPP